eukprot:TRINITY_DN14388_c0_g1_i1.p1 TRINITY_DN14388_c0_g1~~TRINITY_DN14388_c0_g1_i1.p1  ORF type:complete len:113 (-),score=0.84 TRINITY_DN14388_c0_g1_i1:85-423(-)
MNTGMGFLCVYSITSYASFTEVKKYRDLICKVKDTDNVPIVIAGNKSDLVSRNFVLRFILFNYIVNYLILRFLLFGVFFYDSSGCVTFIQFINCGFCAFYGSKSDVSGYQCW